MPGVLTIAMLPFLFMDFSDSLALTGAAFATVRLGAILGGLSSVRIQRLGVSYRSTLISSEFLCAGLLFVSLVSVLTSSPWLAVLSLGAKFIVGNVINNCRASYLRSLGASARQSRTLVAINNLLQVSYGAAGVIILAIAPATDAAILVVCVDIATSILGGILFATIPGASSEFPPQTSEEANCCASTPPMKSQRIAHRHRAHEDSHDFKPIFRTRLLDHFSLDETQRWTLMLDLLIAVAFSGCNALMLRLTDSTASPSTSYGLALVAYSSAFAMSGVLATAESWFATALHRTAVRVSQPALIATLGLLAVAPESPIRIFNIFVLFLFYAIRLNALDVFWFTSMSAHVFPRWQAIRGMIIAAIWGAGETVTALLTDVYTFRIGALCLCAIPLAMLYRHNRKGESMREISLESRLFSGLGIGMKPRPQTGTSLAPTAPKVTAKAIPSR